MVKVVGHKKAAITAAFNVIKYGNSINVFYCKAEHCSLAEIILNCYSLIIIGILILFQIHYSNLIQAFLMRSTIAIQFATINYRY